KTWKDPSRERRQTWRPAVATLSPKNDAVRITQGLGASFKIQFEVDPKYWTTRDVKLIEVHCSIPRRVMTGKRKRYPAAFKARVALEPAKQTRTLAELSKTFQVHPVQISQWKKQLLDGAESLFADGRRREHDQNEALQAELYQQIGRLNMELEW